MRCGLYSLTQQQSHVKPGFRSTTCYIFINIKHLVLLYTAVKQTSPQTLLPYLTAEAISRGLQSRSCLKNQGSKEDGLILKKRAKI